MEIRLPAACDSGAQYDVTGYPRMLGLAQHFESDCILSAIERHVSDGSTDGALFKTLFVTINANE